MFKRVAKRQRRQKQDEAMGLDAETKEVLGLHDSDSDSSSSGSTSDSDSDSGDESAAEDVGVVNEQIDEDEETSEAGSDEEESEGSDDEEPPLSIQAALDDPLYITSIEHDIRACITCPGKLLKNPTMCEVHRSSNAHVRRFKRFTELARQARPETDVREVVAQLSAGPEKERETHDGLSKRAEKRQAKLAKVKAKRAKQKAMKAKGIAWKKEKATKARSSPSASASESEDERPSPPAKKRKLPPDGAGTAPSDTRPQGPKGITKAPSLAHAPTETTENPPRVAKGKSERKRRVRKTAAKPSPQLPSDASSQPLMSAQSGNATQILSHPSKDARALPGEKKRKRLHKEAVRS